MGFSREGRLHPAEATARPVAAAQSQAAAGNAVPPEAKAETRAEATWARAATASARLPEAGETARVAGLELARDARGLALTDGAMTVRGDFTRMLPRVRPANLQREALVKAVRVKGLDPASTRVADATAGLGEDSLLLATAGFSVLLFERNPVIAALLADALERAADTPELAQAAARMRLVGADSIAALPHLDPPPDVVLLDPMFPAKHGDARAKKKLQLLQRLEPPCDDGADLLDAALAARPRKVVVKRPAKGPHLAGRTPSHTLPGKTIRYDVYLP